MQALPVSRFAARAGVVAFAVASSLVAIGARAENPANEILAASNPDERAQADRPASPEKRPDAKTDGPGKDDPATEPPEESQIPSDAQDGTVSDANPFGLPPAEKKKPASPAVHGFVQFEAARAYHDPAHWSKLLTRAEAGTQGRFSSELKWKISGRVDYDAVYSLDDYYPAEVARDQRFNASLRETYLDVEAGDWDFRVGRQHVVWGEMVGLFVADVVSAKDMREFLLPEFEVLRIPQWAARAEYFNGALHAEVLWIPIAGYDETGKPGAEFFTLQPVPPGFAAQYRNEVRPRRNFANTNYGARLSLLHSGWDASAFVYRSMDATPTFYRQIVTSATSPQPTFVFEARHDPIKQIGGTLAKDVSSSVVFKAETVFTKGRQFSVLRFSDPDGVVPQNTLDSGLGLDFSLPEETRLNFQLFQRAYFAHDPDLIQAKRVNGYSIYLNGKITNRLEGQVLWLSALNRTDWLLRPRLSWSFEKNWRWMVGADIFGGSPTGLFGRFDSKDRVYSEVRHSF